MFDIGFSEMIVIAVVALVVIGPERLPKVARTAGHLLGRLQRYVSDVKSDINREMQLEELKKLQAEIQDSARNVEQSVKKDMLAVRQTVDSVDAEIRMAAGNPSEPSSAVPWEPPARPASPDQAPPTGPAARPLPAAVDKPAQEG